jgi:hypothetical protein
MTETKETCATGNDRDPTGHVKQFNETFANDSH